MLLLLVYVLVRKIIIFDVDVFLSFLIKLGQMCIDTFKYIDFFCIFVIFFQVHLSSCQILI